MTPRAGAALLAALALIACGGGERFPASGVVRAVRAEERSVTIEHGDVEGLMPAMTMSFEVADPALLAGLEPGQYVEFTISRSGEKFEIVALEAPESGAGVASGAASAEDPLAGSGEAAPDFALVDQDGRPISLAALRGRPVLLDFIFTHCPGPCPILTGIHAKAREGLRPDERERVHFVSITLDPARDTPAVLRAYAAARRVDTGGWSFATGPVADVDAVVRAYGVGAIRTPGGEIEHTVATFLIDADGNIAKRYLGTSHAPEAIRADIEALL
jgi:cytochrome oxidase Cu insertion factor (SCO1/SenC/PrrC family)/Cu/Ag efflux protein CusF